MYIFQKSTSAVLYTTAAFFSVQSFAEIKKHESWLDSQINKLPVVIEAKESLKASSYKAKSLAQPIYNPELETGYEREGDGINFSIGINQTIDFWDISSVREKMGELAYFTSKQRSIAVFEENKAQALSALVKWKAANKKAILAQDQEKQLKQQLKIVDDRKGAGIITQLDVELIYLNLSQSLSSISEHRVNLKKAQIIVRELLPDWRPEIEVIPSNGFELTSYSINPEWIELHPTMEIGDNHE